MSILQKRDRVVLTMDTLENTVRLDDYDTVITVTKNSLSYLIGRPIGIYEWSLVCRRKDCLSCGRDIDGLFKETTFTANDLDCYMIGSQRFLSKDLWRKLVDSQNIDEGSFVNKYGSQEDYYLLVIQDICGQDDEAKSTPDSFKSFWE